MACPAGKSNAAGDDASGQNTACDATLCGTNQKVVNHTCVPCPAGKTNAAGDDAAGQNTSCSAHKCGMNQYVLGHTCAQCSDGKVNNAGDDASGQDTSCVALASPSSGPSPSAEELDTNWLLQSGGVKASTSAFCSWLGLYLAACLLSVVH